MNPTKQGAAVVTDPAELSARRELLHARIAEGLCITVMVLVAAMALTACGGGDPDDEDPGDGRPGRCVINGIEYPPERCR